MFYCFLVFLVLLHQNIKFTLGIQFYEFKYSLCNKHKGTEEFHHPEKLPCDIPLCLFLTYFPTHNHWILRFFFPIAINFFGECPINGIVMDERDCIVRMEVSVFGFPIRRFMWGVHAGIKIARRKVASTKHCLKTKIYSQGGRGAGSTR